MNGFVMKNTIFALLLVWGFTAAAQADSWECVSGDKSACYVSYVRFFPNTSNYVRAELHDPDDVTGCNYVTVRVGEGTSNLLVVRAIQALLTTALTSGMPIRFYRLDAFGDASNCSTNTVQLSLPGH